MEDLLHALRVTHHDILVEKAKRVLYGIEDRYYSSALHKGMAPLAVVGMAYQTKLVDIPAGTFDGYASCFNQIDRQGDRILRGAYAESIKDRRGKVPLLWQHDIRSPIGVAGDLAEDDFGLKFRGRISREAERGREALALIEIGGLDCFSIGFRIRAGGSRMKGAIRELLSIDLMEISVVSVPADPGARIV